jgi:hypothetical protein
VLRVLLDEMNRSSEPGRMVPGTRLDLEVEVLHVDGRWYPGFLEHWRQRDGTWQGYVRYSVAVGQQHIGWFDYPDQVRAAEGPASTSPPG